MQLYPAYQLHNMRSRMFISMDFVFYYYQILVMAKKNKTSQGASGETTKPKTANKKENAQKEVKQGGYIGIGLPVDEETMRKMKEEAKKL